MVDIIGHAHAIGQAQQIADGGHDIVDNNMLGHQIVHVFADDPLEILGGHAVHHPQQGGQMDKFQDARFLGIKGQETGGVHEIVADHLVHHVFALKEYHVHTGVLDGGSLLLGDQIALAYHHLAAQGADNILCGNLAGNSGGHAQLFVELIAAHAHQVIALGIKEQAAQQGTGAVFRGRLARLLALIDFQALGLGLGGVRTGNGGQQALILAQQIGDLLIGAIAQRAQQHGNGQFAGPVNAHPEHIVGIGFVFQPCAAVGDNLSGVKALACLIDLHVKIRAGRANQLAHDHALGAVDDKGAMFGHEREIAHEHVRFLDFAGFPVFQANEYFQRGRVGQVPFLAPLHGIFGRAVQRVIDKLQHQIFAIIGDGGHIGQNLFQIFRQEPFIRVLLNLDQVWHVQNLVDAREAHPFAQLPHLDLVHHKSYHPFIPAHHRKSHKCPFPGSRFSAGFQAARYGHNYASYRY